jgi:hypothetical protein
MKREITLTASSMAAINFCQRMVALSLGDGYQIKQLELDFDQKGAKKLRVIVRGTFIAFKPDDSPSTQNPRFMVIFEMWRKNKKANWWMSNRQGILLGSMSPLENSRSVSCAEFCAVAPMEIVLSKPFKFE